MKRFIELVNRCKGRVMRSNRNIWHRNARQHWTSGDYTIVPLSQNRSGLIRGSEYLGKFEDRQDAAKASWSGEQPCPAYWVLRNAGDK